MQRIDRIFHTVTTTDDPIIRKLVKSEPKVRECNEYMYLYWKMDSYP